jgi:four helix bundle protein
LFKIRDIFWVDRVFFRKKPDKYKKGGFMKGNVTDLVAYQKSFKLAMAIFETSKSFPKEEKYSLTDQIRRSSRAVSASLAEAYCKRRYESYFISKLSDADMENTETQTWLQFALNCNYLPDDLFRDYMKDSGEIGRLLDFMIKHPEKFARRRTQ